MLPSEFARPHTQCRESNTELAVKKVGELKTRFRFLVNGSAREFLTTVCKNYEENRHVNATAARYGLESHIAKFYRLADEMEDAVVSAFGQDEECDASKAAEKVVEGVRTVAHWLEEVREACIINPASVMVRFYSNGFIFQL